MNRRTALRNIALVTAGTALLPSCMQDGKSGMPLKNIPLTSSQEKMLAALSAAIIPTTSSFIGAPDLKSHEFVLLMVDDCNSPEDQQKFVSGMKGFDKLSHDHSGQIFPGFTAEQKESLLSSLEAKKDIPQDVLHFYNTVKKYTVQSFTSSQQYMTDIRKYKMVPGPGFKGCSPLPQRGVGQG